MTSNVSSIQIVEAYRETFRNQNMHRDSRS